MAKKILVSVSRSNKLCIALHFDPVTIQIIRGFPERTWNPEKKLWELPLNLKSWNLVAEKLSGKFDLSPSAIVFPLGLDLRLKNYSHKTVRSYSVHVGHFFQFSAKQPEEISEKEIHAYLNYLKETRCLSSASVRQAVQALKYYFSAIVKKDFSVHFPIIRKEKKLPEILSEKEVLHLINSVKNPKHALLLKLAYSSGLRVSELVRLKWSDIDLSRRVLRVNQGKGKKDRITILSKKMEYWISQYKQSAMYFEENFFLFPGLGGKSHLSERSAQKVFQSAIQRTNIGKFTSIHSLRHAFATHMLEQGTDIRYIQSLLGHRSLKTTQIYTRVAKTTIQNLTSPIDNLPI